MKLALWSSYGSIKYPKEFTYDKSLDIMKVREKLAEFLTEHKKDIEFIDGRDSNDLEDRLRKAIKESKYHCVILGIPNKGTRFYTITDAKNLGFWEIEDIDISKLWSFECYDGAEFINYYEVVDNNMLKRILEY